MGKVSRVAPVFKSGHANSTDGIKKFPTPGYRLKPGMYARVQLTVRAARERADRPSQRAGRDLRTAQRVRRGRTDSTIAGNPRGLQDAERVELQQRREGQHQPASRRWRCADGDRVMLTAKTGNGTGRGGSRPGAARPRQRTQKPQDGARAIDVDSRVRFTAARSRPSLFSWARMSAAPPRGFDAGRDVPEHHRARQLPSKSRNSSFDRSNIPGCSARPRANQRDCLRGQWQHPPQLRWGTDLNEAADEVRTRVDRVAAGCRKTPTSDHLQVRLQLATDRRHRCGRRLRSRHSARDGRDRPGPAPRARRGRCFSDRGRRAAASDPHRVVQEKITALDLPVDRIVQTIRRENRTSRSARSLKAIDLPASQPGPVDSIDQMRI